MLAHRGCWTLIEPFQDWIQVGAEAGHEAAGVGDARHEQRQVLGVGVEVGHEPGWHLDRLLRAAVREDESVPDQKLRLGFTLEEVADRRHASASP
jgi:hypothetical protein